MSTRPRTIQMCLGLLILAGLVTYLNSFKGQLVFDDLYHLTEVGRVQDVAGVWGQRPVTTLSLALNYRTGGLDPWGYHLVNLLVHLAAGLALFGLVRRVLEGPPFGDRFEQTAHWYALAVALLWLVHPLQTQSVTYVVQRAESLMGLFYLLTLYLFVRGVGSPRPVGWYVAAVGACALGMGTKAVMVTAPLAVLLLDRAVLTPSWREVMRRRSGLYAGLAGTWGVLAATGVFGLLAGDPASADNTVGFRVGMSSLNYAATQPGVILHYLKLCFWPADLCLDYAWALERRIPIIAGATLLVAGLAGASVWALRRRPGLGFLGTVFFLVLAPTSSVLPVMDAAVEHRMYLPLAPVVALVVFSAGAVVKRLPWSPAALRGVRMAALVLVATALSVRTIDRNRDYADPRSLWADVVRQRPMNARAYTELGNTWLAEDAEQAIALYRRAVALRPTYVIALSNLAAALRVEDQLDEALEVAYRAYELRPDLPNTRYAVGSTLIAQERYDEGLPMLRQVVAERPYLQYFRVDYGRALVRASGIGDDPPVLRDEQKLKEGLEQIVRAIALDPTKQDPLELLAHALHRAGDIEERAAAWTGQPGVDRARALAWMLVAAAHARDGDHTAASAACARALAADPDLPGARETLEFLHHQAVTAVPPS